MMKGVAYNQFAGRSLERLCALSDGVFAIAMTLLVLDLRVPAAAAIHSEGELWAALVALAPRMATYLMSFLTLGIFWTGQQTQLNQFSRADRHLAWIHFAFLAAVSLMPFSTAFLAEFIGYRIALLLYWLNILVLGAVLLGGWVYACHAQLFREELTREMDRAVTRRIVIAQGLYACGAALCVFGTAWSIGFIVLVQLNYAIAPPVRWLSRI